MHDILKPLKIPGKEKEKIVLAGELLKKLQVLNQIQSEGWFYQGYYLYWLKLNELWKLCFGDTTWNEFLSQIGVNITTAFHKIDAYDFFIIKHNFELKELANIDVKKIRTIITYYKNSGKKEIKVLIDKARELSYSDFITEITKKEPCYHLNKEIKEENITYCKDCNKKLKE